MAGLHRGPARLGAGSTRPPSGPRRQGRTVHAALSDTTGLAKTDEKSVEKLTRTTSLPPMGAVLVTCRGEGVPKLVLFGGWAGRRACGAAPGFRAHKPGPARVAASRRPSIP